MIRFLDRLRRPEAQPPAPAPEHHTGGLINRVLTDHGVDAHVTGHTRGPTVTLYEIAVAPGTRVEKVLRLERTMANALGTPAIRMLPVIPGRAAAGIEVPNQARDTVLLAEVLASPSAAQRIPLLIGLGRTIHGGTALLDLARMPHLLVGGATGSGKSVFLNSLLVSLLSRVRPERVRLLLIDPKRVELSAYRRVPHLLTPIVTDPTAAGDALAYLVAEMDRRYQALADAEVRNLDQYNDRAHDDERLPSIVAVIDELADLMMIAKDEVEDSIIRLAQLGRAAGIHLVVATQRPTVDVVTGLIKANMPARLAFAVPSGVDARVILDQGGAEKLLGNGDALFLPPGSGQPIRVQAAYVDDATVAATVSRCVALPAPRQVDLDTAAPQQAPAPSGAVSDPGGSADADLCQAIELVVTSQFGSTSMLQRKMRIGFAKAGRLMDQLEALGVVGPAAGAKARDVLVAPDRLEEILATALGK